MRKTVVAFYFSLLSSTFRSKGVAKVLLEKVGLDVLSSVFEIVHNPLETVTLHSTS